MKLWMREVADTDFARWMAEQFRERRPDAKGLRHAAQMMGVSHSMLDYWLFKGGFPLGESVEKIADYFDVSTEDVERHIPPRSAQRRRPRGAVGIPRDSTLAPTRLEDIPEEMREAFEVLERQPGTPEGKRWLWEMAWLDYKRSLQEKEGAG